MNRNGFNKAGPLTLLPTQYLGETIPRYSRVGAIHFFISPRERRRKNWEYIVCVFDTFDCDAFWRALPSLTSRSSLCQGEQVREISILLGHIICKLWPIAFCTQFESTVNMTIALCDFSLCFSPIPPLVPQRATLFHLLEGAEIVQWLRCQPYRSERCVFDETVVFALNK